LTVSPVLFSSKTDQWSTPQDFYDTLHAEFDFGLDAAADRSNTKCSLFIPKEWDALTADWVTIVRAFCPGQAVWLNPPYGRDIGKWVAKAAAEAARGATVVMLIPARTDTRYWHEYIEPIRLVRPADVRFVRGRLKFGGVKNSAPFPSVVVVFRPPENA
jgi:phage N-6-adenine-methyltransferase